MSPVQPTPVVARRRRRWWLRVIFLAILITPMVEIAVIVAVGRAIGGWPTFLLLLVESLLGAVIVRREGGRAWGALRDALRSGQMPSRELADGALVLVGGTLLLTPGFVTDALGLFLVVPLTRPLTRRWLEAALARGLFGTVVVQTWRTSGMQEQRTAPQARHPGEQGPPDVVQGEVVD